MPFFANEKLKANRWYPKTAIDCSLSRLYFSFFIFFFAEYSLVVRVCYGTHSKNVCSCERLCKEVRAENPSEAFSLRLVFTQTENRAMAIFCGCVWLMWILRELYYWLLKKFKICLFLVVRGKWLLHSTQFLLFPLRNNICFSSWPNELCIGKRSTSLCRALVEFREALLRELRKRAWKFCCVAWETFVIVTSSKIKNSSAALPKSLETSKDLPKIFPLIGDVVWQHIWSPLSSWPRWCYSHVFIVSISQFCSRCI